MNSNYFLIDERFEIILQNKWQKKMLKIRWKIKFWQKLVFFKTGI